MGREMCGVIVPRNELKWRIRYESTLPECVLPRGHFSPHVMRVPDGRYIAWQDDFTCGCCEPEEQECFVHWDIAHCPDCKLDPASYDDYTLALMVMRRLWQYYDHGGHSGRSVKSQLLEGVLFPTQKKLPNNSEASVILCEGEKLEALTAIRSKRTSQLRFSNEMHWLTWEELTAVIISFILGNLENVYLGPNGGIVEKDTLHAIARLLPPISDFKYGADIEVFAHQLMNECRHRTEYLDRYRTFNDLPSPG